MTHSAYRWFAMVPATALIALCCGCSSFDNSTAIGTDLINDLDPSIGDPSHVLSYGAGTGQVLTRASSRDSGNIVSDRITIGGFGEEYTIAYVEFDTTAILTGARTVLSAMLQFVPADGNLSASDIALRFVVDTVPQRPRSSAPLGARAPFDSIRFVDDSTAGTYYPDTIEVDTSLVISDILYHHTYSLDSLVSKSGSIPVQRHDTIPARDSLVASQTSFVANRGSLCWYACATDSVAALSADSVLTSTRPDSIGDSAVVFFDTLKYYRVARADTIVYTTRNAAPVVLAVEALDTADSTVTARLDTLLDSLAGAYTDTTHLASGTVLRREYVDSVNHIDDVVDTAIVATTYHRYDSLETRTVYRRAETYRRLLVPDRLDTASRARACEDSGFVWDSVVIATHWHDTLRVDSTGSYTRNTYYAKGTLPKDTTTVRLRTPFFRIHRAAEGMQGLVRINKPNLLIRHVPADTSKHDTLLSVLPCSYADYHVFENSPSSRDTVAFLSRAASRYCRIGLDLSDVWQTALDSAARAGLQTVLAAVAVVPAHRWREAVVPTDDLLFALTADTTVPLLSESSLRPVTVDSAGFIRLDLQRHLNTLWNNGSPAVHDTAWLHVWLAQYSSREWGLMELFAEGTPRDFRVEFFLVDPARE